MGSNYFLNNINRTIGENMRFARQFQANQQAASSQAPNTSNQDNAESPGSLMLILMFQLLSQMMSQNAPHPTNSPTPAMPADPYYSTGLPLQNPAYQFLNTMLSNPQRPSVNFENNISIQDRMNQILSTSQNGAVYELSNRLKTLSPTTEEAQQIHFRIDALLHQEGRTETEIREYRLLWQASQVNHTLQEKEIIATGTPSQEITDTIAELKMQRTTLTNQWNQLSSSSSSNENSLAPKIREALQKGQFTEAQLGQSLKFMLDKTSAGLVNRAASLISELMETGELNIAPFLTNDYLERLSPERREALLHAVEGSGLRMANGKPNSRFIGFMLDQLGRPGNSTTKAFLQQFLRDFYAVHGNDPSTPVGQTLADILRLAGITADDDQQLIFS